MTKKTYKKNVEKQKKAEKKPAVASVSPMQMVKDRFGSKEKLAQAVLDLFTQVKEEQENLKDRLLTAANTQLLRLHEITALVKERFGSKEKLIDHVLTLQNRMKDSGYREKLSGLSLPRLMDLVRRFEKK